MLQDEERIQILSKNPLWINDNGECTLLQNEYDEAEAVRILGNDGVLQDYKISEGITLIPEAGAILYSDQEEAVRYQSLLGTPEGRNLILDKAFESTRKSSWVYKTQGSVESGLYSLAYYDDMIAKKCKDALMEIRYLNDPNSPGTAKIKKVHTAEGEINKLCNDALKWSYPLCLYGVDDRKLINFRLIFEVYSNNGEIYVTSFPVYHKNFIGGGLLRLSYVVGYPVFYTQENAVWYREDIRAGASTWDLSIGKNINRFEKSVAMRQHDEDVKNAVKSTVNFVVTQGPTIYEQGKGLFNWFKNRKNKGGSEVIASAGS